MEDTIFSTLAIWHWATRNWAAIAITLTCLSLAAWLVITITRYVRICLNIFVDTPPPLSMGPVDFQRMEGEVMRFRSFDGTSLRGMRLTAPKAVQYLGTIVFCHEFGSDMYSCARYTRPLLEAGFDIFTFDFRAHGQSSSGGNYKPLQWPSNKELEDVLGACAHVEAMLTAEGKPPQIGLFGISRGGGAGLLAAASDTNIKTIICDGVFSTDIALIALMKRWAYIFARVKLVYEHHPEAFWRFLLWLIMFFAQPKLGCKFPSVRRALQDMQPRAVMFIHGQKDSYIREEQTRRLYKTAPSPKHLWVVPKAKHNQAVVIEPQQYAGRTIAFFKKYLGGLPVQESEIDSPAVAEVA
ncbi:MAG: alpha/beta fold hydrolase [Planctomycetes bacterium]|nr:alpha/beta fold hydrolase [Planctomycetota bacterium]